MGGESGKNKKSMKESKGGFKRDCEILVFSVLTQLISFFPFFFAKMIVNC